MFLSPKYLVYCFYVLSAYFVFVRIPSIFALENGSCDIEKGEQCNEEKDNKADKYTNKAKKWSTYLDAIEKALKDYIPCQATDCSCYFSVLDSDLEPFRSDGISKSLIDSVKKRGVHYQIIDHKLYRQEKVMFGPRVKAVDHFILEIIDSLPNMEFVLNDRDYPQIAGHMKPAPVFSFSKTFGEYDILYPAWSFWAGGPAISLFPTGIGRWDKLRETVSKAGNGISWDNKQTKGFFRGSRTSSERDPLILLSRNKPDLVDAQYSKNQAWKSPKDTLGAEPANEVHFTEHCKYKYLFNFRGVAASFRFKHLFLCRSLVFHVGDEWLEFFYPALKPWIHYIPISTSLKEVEHLLEFAKENDQVVKEIADRGYKFIWEHLRLEDVSCYWHKLLTEYASLLRYKVKCDNKLIHITSKSH